MMSKDTDAKIDQIVDELVTDDAVADQLKSKLHKQIDAKSQTHFTAKSQENDDSDDDMWDNIPV
ncbi:MAG: hypothetical protein ACJAYH_002838 [Celeribacter sp.]|jgi:hypothetical protein